MVGRTPNGQSEVEVIWRILRGAEGFSVVPRDAIEPWVGECRLIEVERGRSLGRPGPLTGSILAIGDGRVRIAMMRAGERSLITEYRGPSELLDEPLWGLDLDNLEMVAVDTVEAVRVPLARVQRLIEQLPGFITRLHQIEVVRRRRMEQRLEEHVRCSVPARVAKFIFEMMARYGARQGSEIRIRAKFTHHEIACYVGSTRETVTLVLRELRQAGAIALDHRYLVVVDEERLRSKL